MDIDKVLRRCRTALDIKELPARHHDELDLFEAEELVGERVMLDTCVFIDQLHGKLPAAVESRILARTIVHSPIVMGEMSFLIGALDQNHVATSGVVDQIFTLLRAMPAHRILSLTFEDTVRGNILAGAMSRILGYPKNARRKAQNDAILAAQASRLGCLLVTRNIADFDRLSQLEPKLRVAFYSIEAA